MTRFASLLAIFASALLAVAQEQPQPMPTPLPPPIPAPVDKPYVGPIQLSVDLTNVTDRVERVHEEIPVEPGAKEAILLYPKWLPGAHSPVNPISALAENRPESRETV